MQGIIDFHSHILPGMDDGSRSPEESVAMLRMEAEQGIGHVIATPHFYPQQDVPERFLERRARAEAALRKEMEGHTGLPELRMGAEVFYFHGISQSDAMREFAIEGTDCILIEMPASPWENTMYRELEQLYNKQGLLPVIAHIDRYIGVFRDHGIPQRLAKLPVLVQANSGFFLKKTTAPMALRLLKKNRIHLLGSDCHDLSSRSPNLEGAVERIRKSLGDRGVAAICGWQQDILQAGR